MRVSLVNAFGLMSYHKDLRVKGHCIGHFKSRQSRQRWKSERSVRREKVFQIETQALELAYLQERLHLPSAAELRIDLQMCETCEMIGHQREKHARVFKDAFQRERLELWQRRQMVTQLPRKYLSKTRAVPQRPSTQRQTPDVGQRGEKFGQVIAGGLRRQGQRCSFREREMRIWKMLPGNADEMDRQRRADIAPLAADSAALVKSIVNEAAKDLGQIVLLIEQSAQTVMRFGCTWPLGCCLRTGRRGSLVGKT